MKFQGHSGQGHRTPIFPRIASEVEAGGADAEQFATSCSAPCCTQLAPPLSGCGWH